VPNAGSARQWELARRRAFQRQLAGLTVGEVSERVVGFLLLVTSADVHDVARDRSGR